MLTLQVRNGRQYKSIYGAGQKTFILDEGPAPKMTLFDKALSIMKKYEMRGNTNCPAYDYAQNLAMSLLTS